MILQPDAGTSRHDTTPADVACDWFTEDVSDEDYDWLQCAAPSRFVIERADQDPSYNPAESCEEHLGASIANLLEGTEVRAIVSVRWDRDHPASARDRDAGGEQDA